jgi:hypothetical protein
MSYTRKEIIVNKYLEFQNNIKQIVDVDIFPTLEEVDVVDLLLFFNMTFGYTTEYESIINDLILFNGVKILPEDLLKVMPIITQFIDEFKLLQKSF